MTVIEKIKSWAKKVKSEIYALYFAYRDKLMPWYAKAVVAITVGYALSPVDLIPDFIPVLGFLDDAILLPALIVLSVKLIPKEIMETARTNAQDSDGKLPKNRAGGVVIICLWIALIGLVVYKIIK